MSGKTTPHEVRRKNPHRGARRFLPVLLALCLLPLAARSQDLTGAVGATRGSEGTDRTMGLSLSYSHDFVRYFAASFSYLNEGHLPGHHRDGFAPQLWVHSGRSLGPRFSLAAGAGPYYYFDTVPADSDVGYADRRGRGIVYSLAATWRSASSRWLYQLRFNRVLVTDGLDTSTLLAGIGYRLDQDDEKWLSALASRATSGPRSELTLLGGRSIVNSYESQRAWARGIEYRRVFGPMVNGSIALLDEGDGKLTRRRGIAAQGWIEPSFYDEKMTLGVGLGPYLATDDHRPEREPVLSGILSLTASYRLGDAWIARAIFSRVISGYHRDTDVILLGLGYRF
jgi:hypothetical protein